VVETDIELEHHNRWPIAGKAWNVCSTTTKYCKRLKKCRSGDIFGAQELIRELPRESRARVVSPTHLYIVNLDPFNEVFTQTDKDALLSCSDILMANRTDI
jgi:hypothetical protein